MASLCIPVSAREVVRMTGPADAATPKPSAAAFATGKTSGYDEDSIDATALMPPAQVASAIQAFGYTCAPPRLNSRDFSAIPCSSASLSDTPILAA